MIARAITTRCFWPPDRSRGYLVRKSSTGDRPTRSRASITLGRRSAADFMPWTRSASPTASSTVIAGLSAALGSWKTICTCAADLREARARLSSAMSSPSKTIEPVVAGTSPSSARPSVDLPLPLSPTRPTTSPRPERQVHVRRTAFTVPVSRPNSRAKLPPRSPKCTDRSLMSMMVSVAVSGFVGNAQLLLLQRLGAALAGSAPRAPPASTRPVPRRVARRRPGSAYGHTCIASGHRGWKRQPSGGSTRSGGAPGMKFRPVVDRLIVDRNSSRV